MRRPWGALGFDACNVAVMDSGRVRLGAEDQALVVWFLAVSSFKKCPNLPKLIRDDFEAIERALSHRVGQVVACVKQALGCAVAIVAGNRR